jgi:hypothetical protein
MNSLCTKQLFDYHIVMLKTKKMYILPVLVQKIAFKVLVKI